MVNDLGEHAMFSSTEDEVNFSCVKQLMVNRVCFLKSKYKLTAPQIFLILVDLAASTLATAPEEVGEHLSFQAIAPKLDNLVRGRIKDGTSALVRLAFLLSDSAHKRVPGMQDEQLTLAPSTVEGFHRDIEHRKQTAQAAQNIS